MTAWAEIVEQIKNQFHVMGEPLLLSMLRNTVNGRADLYKNLYSMRMSSFSGDDRVVVVQDCVDDYDDPDAPGKDISYLQWCLQKINITNCFVIVVSFNPDCVQELEWLRKNQSLDETLIEVWQYPGTWSKPAPRQDSFCVVPWINLYVETQGNMLPCCVADSNYPWANLSHVSIAQGINSSAAMTMRQKMLANNYVRECKNCYRIEDQGFESHRTLYNKKWGYLKPDLEQNTAQDGSLREFRPRVVDLRSTNTCNLMCRTCTGKSSSRLAKEDQDLFDNKTFVLNATSLSQRQQILNDVVPYLDHVDRIIFLGGEPMIMFEHYALLDHLLKKENTHIEIGYTTNFSTLTFKDKNVLDYWKKFTNVKVYASLDGHGKVFEYVRHGAKWQDIEDNFLSVVQQCPHVDFSVSSTVSLFSCVSIMELQKLWHDRLDINKFGIQPVGSDEWSVQMLPYEFKNRVHDLILAHCDWLHTLGAMELATQWRSIDSLMMESNKSYLINEYASVNQARDRYRGENFDEVYPELKGLWQYHDS